MNTETRITNGLRALYAGDSDATRHYCGAYLLVRRNGDGSLFRCDGAVAPNGYTLVRGSHHDADGFLFPRYWSLPRV